jgi:hypothetical protein
VGCLCIFPQGESLHGGEEDAVGWLPGSKRLFRKSEDGEQSRVEKVEVHLAVAEEVDSGSSFLMTRGKSTSKPKMNLIVLSPSNPRTVTKTVPS